MVRRSAGGGDLSTVDEMPPWVKDDMKDAYRRVDAIAQILDSIGCPIPDASDELQTLDRLAQTALMFKEFPDGRGSTCFTYKQCEQITNWLEQLAKAYQTWRMEASS